MVKFDTYVCVFAETKGGIVTKFVTGTHKSYAEWEDGKEAMRFSEDWARDIVYGLTLNGHPAAVVKVVHGVTLKNPGKAERMGEDV